MMNKILTILMLFATFCFADTVIENAFNAGELSPLLEGRTDIKKYYSACRTLENFFPLSQGGVMKRPGTKLMAAVPIEVTVDVTTPPAKDTFVDTVIAGNGKGIVLTSAYAVESNPLLHNTGAITCDIDINGNYVFGVAYELGEQCIERYNSSGVLQANFYTATTAWIAGEFIVGLRFTKDGKYLYCGSGATGTRKIRKFDNTTGEELWCTALSGTNQGAYGMDVDFNDNVYVSVGGESGTNANKVDKYNSDGTYVESFGYSYMVYDIFVDERIDLVLGAGVNYQSTTAYYAFAAANLTTGALSWTFKGGLCRSMDVSGQGNAICSDGTYIYAVGYRNDEAWSGSSRAYYVGDRVLVSGVLYVCIVAHTSNGTTHNTPPGNTTDWEVSTDAIACIWKLDPTDGSVLASYDISSIGTIPLQYVWIDRDGYIVTYSDEGTNHLHIYKFDSDLTLISTTSITPTEVQTYFPEGVNLPLYWRKDYGNTFPDEEIVFGTETIGNTKIRLIPFVYSAEDGNDAYVIECGNRYFRFYMDL